MVTPLGTVANRISGFSLGLSILLIVLGFLAIVLPIAASFGVVFVLAWLLVISGLVQFVHAFGCKGVGHTIWKIVVAAIYVLIGLFLLSRPGVGLATLTLALAAFLVAQGIADIVTYFRLRKLGASGWLLFDGIVTLVLGGMIWRHWPAGSLWIVGTLVGVAMIVTGTTRLMLTLAARRAMKVLTKAA